jgi:hypothetical protein
MCPFYNRSTIFGVFEHVIFFVKKKRKASDSTRLQTLSTTTHVAVGLFGRSYIKVNVPPVIDIYIYFVSFMPLTKHELSYKRLFLTALDPCKYIPVSMNRVMSKGPIVPISTESVASLMHLQTTERRLSSERRRNSYSDIRQTTATSKPKM